jgi:hypothetical protein
MTKAVLIFCILLLSLKNFSQAPKETIDALKKLEFLEGVWKGKGWIMMEGNKQHFNETETVKLRTGGTLLQIDVFGTSVDNDSVIINNGLAIVNYDPQSKEYKMIFYQSDASAAKATVKIIAGNTAEISIHRETGYTRFVIEAKNKQWFEKGFSSSDGKTWNQFFEMKLVKQ